MNGHRDTEVHEVSSTPVLPELARASEASHIVKHANSESHIKQHIEPAVEHEHVQPEQHEKIYRPVDKEIHQEHHHTTVQPIQDREVRPAKHTHVQEEPSRKHVKRRGSDHVRNKLASERIALGLDGDETEVGSTRHTVEEAAVPVLPGQEAGRAEHVHHHVHEHVQPVVEKETVQPVVVHKTRPVHEVHEVEAQHHRATVLPPVSIDEFRRRMEGGGGRGKKRGRGQSEEAGEEEARHDTFLGEPGAVEEGHVGGPGARGTTHLTRPERDDDDGGGYVAPNTRQTTREPSPAVLGNPEVFGDSVSSSGSSPASEHGDEPSLMNKLNLMTDADGDGKAGIMS